jgi:hypothetical protein
MPILFSLIPCSFVLFGLGVEVARVTSPSNRKTFARCIADVYPSLQFGRALPLGFGRGVISSSDSLVRHSSESEFFSPNGRVITTHKLCGEMRRAV